MKAEPCLVEQQDFNVAELAGVAFGLEGNVAGDHGGAVVMARVGIFHNELPVNPMLDALFDVKPKTDYVVKAVEAFRAKSMAAAQYFAGTPDGSRPGIFYINTYDLPSRPSYMMEAVSLHEASPGHHFQISIKQELENMPAFRRFGGYTAYSEGWGLY